MLLFRAIKQTPLLELQKFICLAERMRLVLRVLLERVRCGSTEAAVGVNQAFTTGLHPR